MIYRHWSNCSQYRQPSVENLHYMTIAVQWSSAKIDLDKHVLRFLLFKRTHILHHDMRNYQYSSPFPRDYESFRLSCLTSISHKLWAILRIQIFYKVNKVHFGFSGNENLDQISSFCHRRKYPSNKVAETKVSEHRASNQKFGNMFLDSNFRIINSCTLWKLGLQSAKF